MPIRHDRTLDLAYTPHVSHPSTTAKTEGSYILWNSAAFLYLSIIQPPGFLGTCDPALAILVGYSASTFLIAEVYIGKVADPTPFEPYWE